MNINQNCIPDELKACNRWICWRADRKANGRTDKLPVDKYNPCRKVNSLGNCEPWEAVIRKISGDRALGLGFYPDSEHTGLVGIDLDHVFDGMIVRLEALRIVEELDSYTEYSPSKTGLHIWIRSRVSPDNHNGRTLEIKSRGNNYLTVTGKSYGSPKPIADRTEILGEIIDRYFPKPEIKTTEKKISRPAGDSMVLDWSSEISDNRPCTDEDTIRKLCSNPDRARLWRGDISDYNGDHSRADIALCNHIYWCSNCDTEAVDRLFRRSGLMRDKWDEVHHGDGLTYGQMTIQKARGHK